MTSAIGARWFHPWISFLLILIAALPALLDAGQRTLANRETAADVMAIQRLGQTPDIGPAKGVADKGEQTYSSFWQIRRSLLQDTLSGDIDPTAIVQRYLDARPFPTPVIEQAIASSFVEQARLALDAGREDTAIALLQAVLLLHPGDLYAASRLWRLEPDFERENSLRFPSASALTLEGRALSRSTVEGILTLDESGLWPATLTERVVSNWIWRYPDMPVLDMLLRALTERYPDKQYWRLLQDELGQRQGRMTSAQATRQIDTENGKAFVSALLGVDAADIRLGADQIGGGGFEDEVGGATLDYWSWNVMADGISWGAGLYIGGRDEWLPWEGEIAVRIDGIWQREPLDTVPASAGYQLEGFIPIRPNQLFLVELHYRSAGSDREGVAGINLGSNFVLITPQELMRGDEIYLSDTGGRWQRVTFLITNERTDSQPLHLLLRNWDTGSIWFDAVTLQPVVVEASDFDLQRWLIK